MLFPNHPAYAEIRAGMGYQPGAHALLGYAAPWHGMEGYEPGLGAFSSQESAAALNAGVVQQSDLDLLSSVGATDVDLINLINGDTTLTQLYAQYGVTIPPSTAAPTTAPASATATSTPTPAVQGPSPSQAGQVPSGSTLLYTASYAALKAWTTASSAIQALSPLLPAHGMSILTQQVGSSGLFSSNASFSVTVLDSIGHALVSDAKSVLDALMNQITNNGLQSSTLTVVSSGTVATGQTPAAASTDPVSWLENNAIYIGAAVAALVLLNNFTGRRR